MQPGPPRFGITSSFQEAKAERSWRFSQAKGWTWVGWASVLSTPHFDASVSLCVQDFRTTRKQFEWKMIIKSYVDKIWVQDWKEGWAGVSPGLWKWCMQMWLQFEAHPASPGCRQSRKGGIICPWYCSKPSYQLWLTGRMPRCPEPREMLAETEFRCYGK